MYITVHSSKPNALPVEMDGGHHHDVVRGNIPANLEPLVKLAAHTYWNAEATGVVTYRIALLEDN